jgi:glycosyltransferase involved in cell wall biosynthesis
MIIDKENGLVLSGRYEDDVEKIYSLMDDDGKLFNQLQKNLQKKQNIITWQEVVKQYENIYKKIGAKYEY